MMLGGGVWSGVRHEGKLIGMEPFGVEGDGWGEKESVLGGWCWGFWGDDGGAKRRGGWRGGEVTA